jgi:hypothetical protein
MERSWSQAVATTRNGGKYDRLETCSNRRKRLSWVASACCRGSMIRRRSTVRVRQRACLTNRKARQRHAPGSRTRSPGRTAWRKARLDAPPSTKGRTTGWENDGADRMRKDRKCRCSPSSILRATRNRPRSIRVQPSTWVVSSPSIHETLAASDIVSLHAPLTETTRHLLNERRLSHASARGDCHQRCPRWPSGSRCCGTSRQVGTSRGRSGRRCGGRAAAH